MTNIKGYTDINQSKKLAEILTVDSADMYYINGDTDKIIIRKWKNDTHDDDDIPCWSLAALLDVLPMITKGKDTANPFIAKTSDNEYYAVYATLTKEVDSSGIYDNPVDACYEMALKLHELKKL